MFENYNWPGNLREFRNVVRRAVLLTTDETVRANTLPWEITNAVGTTNINATPTPEKEHFNTAPNTAVKNEVIETMDLKTSASKAEYDAIMKVLQEVNFNKTKAAEVLNIDRKTLYNKIKGYGEISK